MHQSNHKPQQAAARTDNTFAARVAAMSDAVASVFNGLGALVGRSINQLTQLTELVRETQRYHRELTTQVERLADEQCAIRELLRDTSSAQTHPTQQIGDVANNLAGLRRAVEKHQALADALNTTAEDRQRLQQQLVDREIVRPVAMGLIGMLDQIRGDLRQLDADMERAPHVASHGLPDVRPHLRQLREADFHHIQTILHNLGVEEFTSESPQFDPTTQKRIHSRPCTDGQRHGDIARRVLPGYRRDGLLIRRELVDVYVDDSHHASKEGA